MERGGRGREGRGGEGRGGEGRDVGRGGEGRGGEGKRQLLVKISHSVLGIHMYVQNSDYSIIHCCSFINC